MRITAMLLIVFCIHACKENAQEKESEFELNKPEAIDLKNTSLHLGGGLCVIKNLNYYMEEPIGVIHIFDCYNLLMNTAAPTESVMKYRQGGLCFYHDCSIEPKESFTVFMNVPKSFTGSYEYLDIHIFATRYSHSKMLYKYERINAWKSEEDMQRLTYELEHTLYKIGSRKEKPAAEFKLKPDIVKEYDDFWEELFSMSRLLKIKDEDFSEKCNSKFCPTKDFLEPFYKIDCDYLTKSKNLYCYRYSSPNRKIKPECIDRLERLSKGYNILMHSGAFPAGDCDLGNWRYLKIDSLSKDRYEKLKKIVKLPDNYYNYYD